MKRLLPYPFLLLIAIIINRVIISSMQISPTQSLRSLIVLLITASVVSAVIYQQTRDWHRTDFLVALSMVFLLIYQTIYRWFKSSSIVNPDIAGLILIPCLAASYIIANHKLWSRICNPVQTTHYLNLVFMFLVGFQLIQFSMEVVPVVFSNSRAQTTAIAPFTENTHLDPATRPDIYIIVLDGYGRQDVLKKIYDYDNSEFVGQLEEHGFYVARESHSNYVQTPYAVASMMNFDYVQPWRSSSDYAQYLLEPIQNNRVFQLLNEIGYTTVSFDGAASYTQIQSSDVYLSNFLPLNKFETFLLADTPLEPLTDAFNLGLSIPNYETHRLRTLSKLNAIQNVPAAVPGPKITYFHILVPHPPFVFDENGNSIQPNRPYSIMDGNEFQGSPEEYWAGYRRQVIFANKKILTAVDAILAESKIPPIIILMGDHGPGLMFKWDQKEPGCIWERTHNLYAVLLPGHQNDDTLYPTITPVNTFRVIFNTYFGTDLPLLEDRTYLMAWQYPSEIVDVTDRRDSTNGCTFQGH